jgi:protein-S-isoprenylcysteine O-methyltransferase Ste14
MLLADLVLKLNYEERLLAAHHPDYALLQQKTWRLAPFIY